MARICWEEMRKRSREGRAKSDCEGKRKMFVERGGRLEELERKREGGEAGFEELEKKDKERQREEKWDGIRDCRFNK